LSNSVGQANVFVDASLAEPENFFAVQKNVTNNEATGESGFALGGVQPYNYTGIEAVYFRNSEITINNSAGIESITFPFDHGITDNTLWLYVPGELNAVIPGLAGYVGYFVRVISPNSIYLTTVINGTTRVDLTGTTAADGGVMRSAFIRGYRMTSANTTNMSITFNQAHGFTSNENQPVLFFNGTASNLAVSTSLHTNSTVYYPKTVVSTTAVSWTTTPGGTQITLTSATATAVAIKATLLPDRNSIYFSGHGLIDNSVIVFSVLSGTAPGGLANLITYKAEPIGSDRIRFKNNDTLAVINLTTAGTAVSQYRIETRTPIFTNDAIFAPNHVFRDGLEVIYDNQGNTTIPGLVDEQTYFVFQRTQNHFKLATNTVGWKTDLRSINQASGVNSTTDVITTTVNHGFTTADAVQYLSATPIGGLENGAFYWARVTAVNTLTLHWTKNGANTNTDFVNLTLPLSGTGTLRAANLIDLTGTSTGSHRFRAVTNSASDGVYDIIRREDSRTFVLGSNAQIPERDVFLNDSRSSFDFSRSAIRFNNHSYTTGTRVRYQTTGNAVGGLINEGSYFIIRISRNWFRLATTLFNANEGTFITFTSQGTGTHRLLTASVSGVVVGPGTISISLETDRIIGIGTNFTAVFSPGDQLTLYQPDTTANKTVSSINLTTDVFTSTSHGMSDGTAVIMAAAAAPGGTTNGFIYYTRSTGLGAPANEFSLHPTFTDAQNNTNKIDVTSAGTTVVVQQITGIGSTSTVTIKYVNSTTEIILTENVIENFTSVFYAIGTSLFVRADGFALHRPYDGGVELIPSTNPDAAMIRQTRKYFRYQSGKGIQVSFAVNFSPTVTLENLTVSLDQEKIDKCERDIGYIIDGVAFDIVLGTNYNARFLAFAELNSLDINPVVIQVIERSRDVILGLPEVDDSVTAENRVNSFYTELLNILDQGREAASPISFTNPSTATTEQIAAKDKLLANIDFIIAEVNAFVEFTFSPTDHDITKCTRDLKYAIWGFAYDILYGGNSATYDSAKFFEYGYADGDFGIINSHINQTIAGYERLRDILGDIVLGIFVTPTVGNTVNQDISGDAASSTEVDDLYGLANIVVDTIREKGIPDSLTRIEPDVSWASQELQDAKADIDSNKTFIIENSVTSEIGLTTATGVTRYPHRLTVGVFITVYGAQLTGGIDRWNGVYRVTKIIDDYTFQYNLGGVPSELSAAGITEYFVNNWQNSRLKCGLFDDQNGLYFEYDGQELNCVRRSSVQQISGTCSVTFKSGEIVGLGTKFSSQLAAGDRIVIKGQTYLITEIVSNTLMYILPSYRGTDNDNVIITKTVDTKIPQPNWSLDRCNGTGPSGFFLDIHKIQMAYMDYSWYGAGKVRFGFKDQDGQVIYVHEFIHNNKFTEAYMRSGNLPARYEVENAGIPTYVPSLAHWGTSVIMDGRFDDDKAYVFTASSNSISITGSASLTVSARVEDRSFYQVLVDNQYRNASFALLVATPSPTFNNIPSNTLITGAGLQANTRTALPQDSRINPRQPYLPSVNSIYGSNTATFAARTLLLLDRQPTTVAGAATNYTVTLSSVATPVVYEQPLISIRLAPSVDTGTPGALGQREIINRMQLILSTVGILSTHSAEISLKLNGQLNNNSWQRVTNPSLSQLIYHSTADTIIGGTTVYSFRAQGGTGTTARTPVITTAELGDLATLGNAILGGDSTFPDGPDVLTVVAKLVEDPSTVSTTNPFNVTGRISWSESQA